jgi:hypothetical protein
VTEPTEDRLSLRRAKRGHQGVVCYEGAVSSVRGDYPKHYGKRISAAVAAFLCATPAPAQTVAVNYGGLKEACSQREIKLYPQRTFDCMDWEVKFRDLVSRLDAQFAANPLCHGIEFTTLEGLHKEAGEGNLPEHWTLYLYPSPGQDSQGWVLWKPGIKENDFRGEGRPNEIARDICAVVAGRGGVIRK